MADNDADSDQFLDARSEISDSVTCEVDEVANCSSSVVLDLEAALDVEWQAVEHGTHREEFERVRQLRNLVSLRGLDSHSACVATPHSRRAVTLLRYLRARAGDIGHAAEFFESALDWRRDFDFDRKMADWRVEWHEAMSPRVRLLRRYNFIARLGVDREGLPVYLHRFSQGDPGGLVREIGEEAYLLYLCQTLEDCFAEAQDWILRTRRIPGGFVEVYDVGNYGLVPNWIPRAMATVGPYKTIGPLFDKVYPERVKTCFVLRAPLAFSMVWKLALPMIPEATRAKIRIKSFKAKSWLDELREVLTEETIPSWLRVDDPANFPHVKPWGGIVPKGALVKEQRDDSL